MLCVPWRTLAGLCSEPGQLSRVGPVTAGVARDLSRTAAADPACAWKVIVVGRSGRALAAVNVRRPAGARRSGGGSIAASQEGNRDAGLDWGVVGGVALTIPVSALRPGALGSLELAGLGMLGQILSGAVTAAASELAAGPRWNELGTCTHDAAAPGYRVPDRMRAWVEARDQTCRYPICRRPAGRCDQDHTIPYRLGGATCPCNLSADCTRHHRLKHLPNWRLDQPRPGVLTWTTPAGLRHTVNPDPYPA